MKKTNKKGFTIVELVIVIAVIAILAGVMIPTFGGIIETAQESAEMQAVAAAYKEAYALALADDGAIDAAGEEETVSGYKFTIKADGTCTVADDGVASNDGYDSAYGYAFADGKWTVHAHKYGNDKKCTETGCTATKS